MPVRAVRSAGAGCSSDASPRNLLSTNPNRRSRVASGTSDQVPNRWANEPPRSMSLTSSVAASTCSQHPVVHLVAEVGLGRAAGALDHDQLVVGLQRRERVGHRRPEMVVSLLPRQRAHGPVDHTAHHHLAARVGLRLHEHRVHPHVGHDAGGARLQPLSDPDLAAGDDAGVVRHVLRLVRRHVDALAPEPRAQRRRQQALPRRRRTPHHHQRPVRRHSRLEDVAAGDHDDGAVGFVVDAHSDAVELGERLGAQHVLAPSRMRPPCPRAAAPARRRTCPRG